MGKTTGTEFIGLEIADSEVRLVVARAGTSGYVLHGYRRALPLGAVVSDFVVEPEAVVEALRGVLAAAGVRRRRATLVLGGERTICRVEPLAVDDDPHAMAACEERMRRYVLFGGRPIAIGHVVQPAQGHDGCASRLLSAAAPEALVLCQVDAAKRCGVAVERAEPAMAAIVRTLLATDGIQSPKFLLLADSHDCEVGILRQDGLIFCHRLRIPADAAASDAGWLLATLDQLQDYHLRHARGEGLIGELLCCGLVGPLEGVLRRLGDAGIRVTWLDPAGFPRVERLEGDGLEGEAERAAIAPAVAGALAEIVRLPGPGNLNLLPPSAKRGRRNLLAPCITVPVLLTLAVTAGMLTWDWLIRREAARLVYLVNNPTPEMLESSRLQQRESYLKQRVLDGRLLLQGVARRDVPRFLTELPQRLPSEAWLSRIEIDQGDRCFIDGKAQAEDAVFAFVASLRRSPCVKDVRISRAGSEREGEVILTCFRLDVGLTSPEPPADKEAGHE